MLTEIDIYCSTNVLLKRHGPDAPIHAAMRADVMLDKGDLDGYDVWKLERPPWWRGFSFVSTLECRLLGVDRTWRGGGRNFSY